MSEDQAKILIVDDETTNIDVLVGLLEHACKTVVAKNGEQAIKRAKVIPRPDLILLDIVMPDIDGFEVCRRLKADPETSGIPIIFITGKESEEDETQGLAVGAVDFIRKPFRPAVALARIQTQLALQRQRLHLIELNEIKNRFLGMAAHDLRNPLNSISGLSEILLTMELDETEERSFIQTIHDVSGQMLKLIHDLLDVTTLESGHFVLDKQRCDLSGLVAERVEILKFAARQKGVTIRTELTETPGTPLDPDRLAQVIDNLLSNAIKFTPSDSEVQVRVGTGNNQVYFQVVDQGPGIPDTERHRLFEAFQKLSTRPTAREKSTGLGLSIVKRIVDAHHGEIVVANNVDRGAIFTCFFPGDWQETPGVKLFTSPLIRKPLRLLLIDDDYALRLMYGKAFAEEGFEWVGEAENGREGVELYQSLKPDLVICDITMPVMDGMETLQAIFAKDPNACVIMLTSCLDQEKWTLCLAKGARYTLRKDTPFPEIRRKVLEIWKEYQSRFAKNGS
ncbi:MAG: response regulator [Magnetococcales bacterium]|nr:response regulator [Magnetococcales bacterium]